MYVRDEVPGVIRFHGEEHSLHARGLLLAGPEDVPPEGRRDDAGIPEDFATRVAIDDGIFAHGWRTLGEWATLFAQAYRGTWSFYGTVRYDGTKASAAERALAHRRIAAGIGVESHPVARVDLAPWAAAAVKGDDEACDLLVEWTKPMQRGIGAPLSLAARRLVGALLDALAAQATADPRIADAFIAMSYVELREHGRARDLLRTRCGEAAYANVTSAMEREWGHLQAFSCLDDDDDDDDDGYVSASSESRT